jgi:hypothetical protein
VNNPYRVVVPFAEHEVGDILGVIGRESGGVLLGVQRVNGGGFQWIDLEFIADKVEEVKPKTLRSWLVEEVATRKEAAVYEKYPTPFRGAWVKITEQKEVPAEPERWVPEKGESYYSNGHEEPLRFIWMDSYNDREWLKQGEVFKTKQECQAYMDRKKVSKPE